MGQSKNPSREPTANEGATRPEKIEEVEAEHIEEEEVAEEQPEPQPEKEVK